MVGQPLHEAEQSPFKDQGERELADRYRALLGLRRLLIVEKSPQSPEQPLADDARKQAGDDAEWSKYQLDHGNAQLIPTRYGGHPNQ